MELQFTITDPQYYERELIKTYENIAERTLYPADPERLILDVITYITTLLAFKIDWSAKQNLLAYAEHEYLDALAEFYGVKRLPAQPAKVLLKFYVETPATADIIIPKGTRVTPDGKIIFFTTQETRIPAGETSIEIMAECETPGSLGNGFTLGQIQTLLDPLPEVKVTNTTVSMYGADPEDDSRFRERIRLSIERFSNAGSKEAYIYHTLSADSLIEDVSVISPSPGQVAVYILLRNGELPSNEMLQKVKQYLNDEKIRPLTDQVFVQAPEVVTYEVTLRYFIHKKDEAKVSYIMQAVEKAVKDFVAKTGSQIGKDVLPEELIWMVRNAGAYKIELISPEKIAISPTQVAKGTINSITYMGLSDD